MADPNKPKFVEHERIKPNLAAPFSYKVLETPLTCTRHGHPAYQLQCMKEVIDTPPFFRVQEDVENNWISFDYPEFKFPEKSLVKHVKTGGIYRIVITPDVGRLEANDQPAYSYVGVDGGKVWHRNQADMEDGRFEALP